jgi:hypothetical protein
MFARFEVDLNGIEVTGQALMDLVSQLSGSAYVQELVQSTDAGDWYQVGKASSYPDQDLEISVDGSMLSEINPEKTYTSLHVQSTDFGGLRFAVHSSPQAVKEAVKGFRDQLQKALATNS